MATFANREIDASAAISPALTDAIGRARNYLLRRQDAKGYWVGELEADASVTAGYIPLMHLVLGEVDPVRRQKAVNFVLSKQAADGSWSAYHGGPGDLSVSIQVYFALKLAGVAPEASCMRLARDFILSLGGVTRANVFTKVWLALFGQFDWRGTPAVPPEIVLLPKWCYFNIYEFASWSRATIVALSVVLTRRPVCPVTEGAGISELYVEPLQRRTYPPGRIDTLWGWRAFFLVIDRLLKAYERLPIKPGRDLALRRAERWIVEHQEADGSWAGIMLPWIYSLAALKSLGYPPDHPVYARGLRGLEGFIVEDGRTMRLQPATSPVWDTAWTVLALRESGLAADHPSLMQAARWLLGQEIKVPGDWQVKNPDLKPGCWAFEFENDLYPDLDDTPVVARALRQVRLPAAEEAPKTAAVDRALCWVLGMQGRDGGWAAFDRDNDRQALAHVPFAEFMSPLDPTCPDVTAHVVELLGEVGYTGSALSRAIAYFERTQEPDGPWYGRWGVNYLYGTGLALAGLRAANALSAVRGVDRAVSWLLAAQNGDGGWGETCRSYDDPGSRGAGPSTASQTAWALMGLIAAGRALHPAVSKGIDYLLSTQAEDGCWHEVAFTGTGFPRAFYLRYDLYRAYFPLIALSRYKACMEETR